MKQLFHITKETMADASVFNLFFVIGDKHCCFGILENSSQALQQVTYYILDGRNEFALDEVFEKHPELNATFNETKVSYYYPEALLSPSHISNFENAEAMLDSLYGPSFNQVINSENIGEWQINNSYAIPEKIHQFLCNKYRQGKFFHEYSVVLRKLLTETGHTDSLIIDFIPDQFAVYVIQNGQFKFAQKQDYKNAEDLIYFLVKLCDQFSIDRQKIKLLISGLIDKDSGIFNSLQQYFIDIEFRKMRREIKMDENIHNEPAHYFVSLFNLSTCE